MSAANGALLPRPIRVGGAMLDAGATHKGRSAYDYLLYLAQTRCSTQSNCMTWPTNMLAPSHWARVNAAASQLR